MRNTHGEPSHMQTQVIRDVSKQLGRFLAQRRHREMPQSCQTFTRSVCVRVHVFTQLSLGALPTSALLSSNMSSALSGARRVPVVGSSKA